MNKNFRKISLQSLKVCLIIIQVFMLSGCWDSLDLEKRAIVLGLAIDKADKDAEKEADDISHLPNGNAAPNKDMLKVTVQIAVPGKIPLGPESGGGGEKEPVSVIEVVGHTLDDALASLQQQVAIEIFLGHLRIIVIGEELAKDGIERLNDFFRRNSEIRRTAWFTISKGQASKFMEITPKLERIPSLYITAILDDAVDLGKFPTDFIGHFWTVLSSKGQAPYLPYIEIKKRDNVQISGLAYFSEDKLVDITTPISIGLFMAVKGEEQGGYGAFVQIPDTDEFVMVRAVRRDSKISIQIKNGRPTIDVKIHYEGEIDENDSQHTKLNNMKILQKIEKEAAKSIIASVEKLIKQTQENHADIFGFGEHVRAKHPMYWDSEIKTKENWHNLYPDLAVNVDCTFRVRRVGMKAE